jgi:hypothetical protein
LTYDIGIAKRRLIIPPDETYFAVPAPGFVPCPGTAIHLADPNNLTTGNWSNTGLNVAFNATDPNGVALNATDLKSSVSGGSLNANVRSAGANIFTLFAATGDYTFSAYLKWVAGPPWVLFFVTNNATVDFGAYFNIVAPMVGTTFGDLATLTCARAVAFGVSGYTQVSIAGHVASDTTGMNLEIALVDGNGTNLSTLNQDINAWQVSP